MQKVIKAMIITRFERMLQLYKVIYSTNNKNSQQFLCYTCTKNNFTSERYAIDAETDK